MKFFSDPLLPSLPSVFSPGFSRLSLPRGVLQKEAKVTKFQNFSFLAFQFFSFFLYPGGQASARFPSR
jgi:hypothetical protein